MPIYSPSQTTKGITVSALEPKAVFSKLYIQCLQLDGTWAWFNILTGEGGAPRAKVGSGTLKFEYMNIVAYSLDSGKLFIRVVDDVGVQIGYWEATGAEVRNLEVIFNMPNRSYGLTVYIGHDTTVDDSRSFTITPIEEAIATNITISAPDTVKVGAKFDVSGVLKRSDTGAGLAGQTVNVYYNGTLMKSVITDSGGYYLADGCSIPTAGSYTLEAAFPGSTTYSASAVERTIGVGVELPPELDLPTIGGIALAVANAALIGYYAITQLQKP